MFGPDPIGADAILSLLQSSWSLDVDRVEYAAIGYGSYHWYANGNGGRWLVTADRDDGRPVVAAYELTHELGERFGFVRSPLPARNGDVVVGTDGWLLSVWPWVVGRSGSFGDGQSPGDVSAVARCLRQLHDYSDAQVVSVLVDELEIPGRAALDAVLKQQLSAATGPYAAEVVDRVAANRSRLLGMLAEFEELAVDVRANSELVITHGEPHIANLVHGESDVVLIDWDTVRWAPRERDLWWLPGASWREAYGVDLQVSESAIAMYRLRWTLFDVADFVPALLGARSAAPDLDVAMDWVCNLLPL